MTGPPHDNAAAPPFHIFERSSAAIVRGVNPNDLLDYLVDKSVFDYKDGFVAIPQGPGLGIEIDGAYVRQRAAVGHDWHKPVWRNADRSVAQW